MNNTRLNYLIANPTEEIDDIELLELYRFKCVICRKPTGTIHEIHPRSLMISWRKWINRVPICYDCHDKAHKHGTISSRDYLILYRNQRLGEYWNIWLMH